MVVHAVMRAWRQGLDGPPPTGRVFQPQRGDDVGGANDRQRSAYRHEDGRSALDDSDEDPSIDVTMRDDLVPRRPGRVGDAPADESFWSSHHFWKGVVIGAAIVLLVKTAMAVRAPFGIDWYLF